MRQTGMLARRLLDRLRDLGRRIGDVLDDQTRPWEQRRVPAPVPVEVEPRVQRRPRGAEGSR